jgi:hypothetical protein
MKSSGSNSEGVPTSFIRINGAEHGFAGAAPADLERAYGDPRRIG